MIFSSTIGVLCIVASVVRFAGAGVSGADSSNESARKDAVDREERQPSFWSFQLPVDPPLPRVKRLDWPLSPLDFHILASLEASGLDPAPPTDKRTLIRRATFDLIGLPPTPDEIRSFLDDESPDAFARVVDRLLASPHYGERWGRHWLDVARYADSNGMDENLAYANAFRYRDYVVAAFNQDKPYSQFVGEQLAGDILPSTPSPGASTATGPSAGAPESFLATGFLSLGPKMLAEDDPVKMEMDIIDEQVDTIGRTFLGLTLGCARCHDHKFDPLGMEDYYALAGIFKSTKTMDNFKVVARWHERVLGTADEVTRQEAKEREIAAAKSEISRVVKDANEALLRAARRRAGDYLLAARVAAQYELLQQDLKSLIEPMSAPGSIVLEAEDFARGNVKREFTGYGEKIGVIYNQGELPNFAEYDIELEKPGTYQFEIRYAAAEARPVLVLVNDRLVKENAAAKATGSWFPDTQTWSAEAVLGLPAGKNTIRLERSQPFPHLDKLALVPREIPADFGAMHGEPKTFGQIAAEGDLNVEILRQWMNYLQRTKSDTGGSPLAAWNLLTTVSPDPSAAAFFTDLQETALRAVARRYQELFDGADQAWQELKARSGGNDVKELPDSSQEALRQVLYDPKGPFALPSKPEPYYSTEVAGELKRLREQMATLEKSYTPLPEAMAVHEGAPQDLKVHLRGNHLTLGDQVPRGFPRIIVHNQPPIDGTQSGRLQLVQWLTRPDHPLTSRVMVNRIWHWHFGDGLVRTTDNFGQLGDRPSHPALLDWLAVRFVESGWSIKSMHRLIMLSATYQMSTAYDERGAQVDPENRLYWRMNRRRLEAEVIRDAMLAVSGQLDLTMGGSLLDSGNRTYVKGYPNSIYDKYDFPRRSIYLPVLRSMLYDVFQAFDFADPSTPNGERASTTVAPQALFALNSKLMSEQSGQMASALLAVPGIDDGERIGLAYERAFGRLPHDMERGRALEFIERYGAALRSKDVDLNEWRQRSWQALCRTLLASSEFIYID